MLSVALGAVCGQAVHGTVADGAGHPVRGVVISLLEDDSIAVAQSLTSVSGAFRLAAPHAGTYRIRTLRIGFRPTVTTPFELPGGVDVARHVSLDPIPVALDTVHVTGKATCGRMSADSSALVFAAWEQVRGALAAARLTANLAGITATTIDFERELDGTTNRIREQRSAVHTKYVREPWHALAPDSLHQLGYVQADGDSTTYYAPGLDMLLAPVFVEDHCFRIGTSEQPTQLAIEFEPAPQRHGISEIRGTARLDRSTSELRGFEFKYVNVPAAESRYAGGDMEFARTTDGGWVISRWSIRTPVLERLPRSASSVAPDSRIARVVMTGGALTSVVKGRDTVWRHAPVTLAGTVLDSTSGDPVAGARVALAGTKFSALSDARGRFEISGILPGEYTAELRTPALDSLDAIHQIDIVVDDSSPAAELRVPSVRQLETLMCGNERLPNPGIIAGKLHMLDTSIPNDARVTAQWSELVATQSRNAAKVMSHRSHYLDARVSGDGRFRLCGVPVNTDVTVSATATGAETPSPVTVRIPTFMHYGRADLEMVRVAEGRSAFAGSVSIDVTGQSIRGARIELTDIGRIAISDESGAFRIADIPAGVHHVQVRRLGYAPLDTALAFADRVRLDRRIQLHPVAVLDSMRVTVAAIDRSMMSFEDHRLIGQGHFLTREDLRKKAGLTLASVLEASTGARWARGHGSQAWPVSGRGSFNGSELVTPDADDRRIGAQRACYAKVYLDGQIVYGQHDGEPLFDVNQLSVSDLEAVEYYAGPAETPIEYSGADAHCGVLVLWTRRSP